MLGFGWLSRRPDLVAGVTDVFNEGGVNEVKTTEISGSASRSCRRRSSPWTCFLPRRRRRELATAVKARDEAEPIRVVPAVLDFLRFIAPSRSDIWGRRMQEDPRRSGPAPSSEYVPESTARS